MTAGIRTTYLLLVLICLAIVILHLPGLITSIESPAPPLQEPYGGCDEAYLYPGTPGAQICQEMELP